MKTIAIVSADAHIKPHERLLTKIFSSLHDDTNVNAILIDLTAFALLPKLLRQTELRIDPVEIYRLLKECQKKADWLRWKSSAVLGRRYPFIKPDYDELEYVDTCHRLTRVSTWKQLLPHKSSLGLSIGHVPVLDLVLATKKRLQEFDEDQFYHYKIHVLAADLAQQAIARLLRPYSECNVVFYNDYTIQQSLRLYCQSMGIISAKVAGIPGDSKELDGFFVSNMYGIEDRYAKRLLWPSFGVRNLTVSAVRQVYAELRKRSFKPTVHTYSPAVNTSQSEDANSLIVANKKTITLFTSSPEESDKDIILASLSPLEFPRDQRRYNDHSVLVADFVEFAKLYHHQARFIVRIHPRSGRDRRGGGVSAYLDELYQILGNDTDQVVTVIEPETAVSSYWLGLSSDLSIVQASSIGLELACMGSNVAVACVDDGLFSSYPISKAYTNVDSQASLRLTIERHLNDHAQPLRPSLQAILEAVSIFTFQEFEFMHRLSGLTSGQLSALLTADASPFVQFERMTHAKRRTSLIPFTDLKSRRVNRQEQQDLLNPDVLTEIQTSVSRLRSDFGFSRVDFNDSSHNDVTVEAEGGESS